MVRTDGARVTATTIWSAMDGLKDTIAASSTLQLLHCPVDLGFPHGGPRSPHHVWIPAEVDDLDTISDLSGSGGVGKFEEQYQLRVYMVATTRADRTFADHRDEIAQLVDATVDAVRADQQLGGAVHLATPGQLSVGESFADRSTRHLNAVLWVRVHAFVC